MTTNKLGRPSGESQTRAALIESARACFLNNSYERVSIRELARRANVDAAMIRYYFGSKAGLFETMVRDTMAPVLDILRNTLMNDQHQPIELMHAYYQMMAANPALPRLIYQVMNNQSSNEAFDALSSVFLEILEHSTSWVQKLAEHQQLNTGLDPKLVRLSFISLMVFPLIAPKAVMQHFGFTLSDEMLATLLQHNHQVMQNGLFSRDTLDSTTQERK
ncbi:hypothetical protein HR45_04805 [Shewanella mangrovi]|uniref:HTH tetR-type domain-containing protein n=1 Tax=Shewanella mangrovi TaxID=1515746 RepID=A0A094JL08_9GAMM|nr:TetR/AcrR family transcriptional regulator [Shewanella mangrovi]KFZ38739.1 hypothetical protein HR45_04805 [Shewanella mangrovi]